MSLKKYISLYILTAFLSLPLATDIAFAQVDSMSDSYNLLEGVRDKNYGIVRTYLQKGANVNTRAYETGETPLYIAATLKDPILVTFLLQYEAKPDIATKATGETPLMAAVRLKSREIVDLLISQNADVNIQDKQGETALYKAVQVNDRELVKSLLAANADWSLADNTGRTPMDVSRENRRLRSIIRILEDSGVEY